MISAFIYDGVGRVEWFDWFDGYFVTMRKELQISLTKESKDDFLFRDRAILRLTDGPNDQFSVLVPSAAVLRKIGEVATAMADQLDKQKAYKKLEDV